MAVSGSILGHPVVRLEDPALLSGEAKYTADLTFPGALHIEFVRSTVAHATLLSVDVTEAKAMPGVVAVYSGDDLGLASFQGFPMMPPVLNRPIFATERVRFVGDIVAAVVAETKAQAVDAAEAVVVEYDPLPVVVSWHDALRPDAPLLFPEHGSNVCFATNIGEDVDPLADADEVAEVTMVSQRLAGVPMESNNFVAVPGEPDGGLTCWLSHQAPHSAHAALAACSASSPRSSGWCARGSGAASAPRPPCTSSTSSSPPPPCVRAGP